MPLTVVVRSHNEHRARPNKWRGANHFPSWQPQATGAGSTARHAQHQRVADLNATTPRSHSRSHSRGTLPDRVSYTVNRRPLTCFGVILTKRSFGEAFHGKSGRS